MTTVPSPLPPGPPPAPPGITPQDVLARLRLLAKGHQPPVLRAEWQYVAAVFAAAIAAEPAP